MARIVVTGGAGFIGSHLVDELVRTGEEVLVLDNLRRGRWLNLTHQTGVQCVTGDIRDIGLLRALLAGADTVYHLAAQSNVLGALEDPDYSFTTNVAGTVNVFRAALEAQVGRVVFSSSREVYGDVEAVPVAEEAPLRPKNLYGASKAAGEMYARVYRAQGLDIRVLRLANVYGPRDTDRVIPRFIARALRGEPMTIYGGDQVLDFIWVGHVVRALVRAAHLPALAEPVNVGSGQGTTVRDLAERIRGEVSPNAPVELLPPRTFEVGRFIADVRRGRELLDLPAIADPLDHLGEVVAWLRGGGDSS
ncbi:MAG TPA: SDR family NAD(P)-dependent oxidoreductase [Isosphaeraceae bacterium]|nr:SDR family NAD(P)-dependent oxidoreductase [Isosphaeraceae bacterium]